MLGGSWQWGEASLRTSAGFPSLPFPARVLAAEKLSATLFFFLNKKNENKEIIYVSKLRLKLKTETPQHFPFPLHLAPLTWVQRVGGCMPAGHSPGNLWEEVSAQPGRAPGTGSVGLAVPLAGDSGRPSVSAKTRELSAFLGCRDLRNLGTSEGLCVCFSVSFSSD